MTVELDLLDEMVFTKLSDYVMENLTEPILTDENFSTVENDLTGRVILPFVYLSNIVSTETGTDLECDRINGGLFTYQIKVTTNDSQEQAKDIMNVVSKAMKSMGFRGTSLPVYANHDNLYIMIARWQRTFCEGDEI